MKQRTRVRRCCRRRLFLGLIVTLALAPVFPVHATTPGHEGCLTAWAEMKGWTRDPYAFGFVDGSDSHDIFIVYDRGDDWVNMEPYENRDDTRTRNAFQKRENIVTADGFRAVKIHKMTKCFNLSSFGSNVPVVTRKN